MTQKPDLDAQEVRDLVEDATRHHGAPWKRVHTSDGGFYGVTDRNGSVIAGSPAVTALIAQAPTLIPELLDRLEQAEQDRDAALEANKRWAHRSSRETSALRKANASIARVRALRNTWCDASYDPMNSGLSIAGTVNAIDRALDGDGRG